MRHLEENLGREISEGSVRDENYKQAKVKKVSDLEKAKNVSDSSFQLSKALRFCMIVAAISEIEKLSAEWLFAN